MLKEKNAINSDNIRSDSSHTSSQAFNEINEIDLLDLFKVMWEGKIIILGVTLLSLVVSIFYVSVSPKIYESKGSFMVDPDPYGYVERHGYSVGGHQVANLTTLFPILTGDKVKESLKIRALSNSQSFDNNISFSKDIRTGTIVVSSRSTNSELSYNNVSFYLNNINEIFKENELYTTQTKLDSIKELSESSETTMKDGLEKVYADLLFKKSILLNPNSHLVYILTRPSKSVFYVKPNRNLIIIFGVLSGFSLGIMMVFFRKLIISRNN